MRETLLLEKIKLPTRHEVENKIQPLIKQCQNVTLTQRNQHNIASHILCLAVLY